MNTKFNAVVTAIGFNSVSGTGLGAYYEWVHTSPDEQIIEKYDPESYLGTKGIRFLNKATLMYCNLTYQCIKNHGLEEFIAKHNDRIGLYDGTDLSNIEDGFNFDLIAKMDGADLASPMSAPNTIANAASSMMAIKSNIKGPNFSVCGGACGSLQALDVATLHLSQNMVDYAVVASTEVTSKYHKAVRLGENRGLSEEKSAPEMGFAFVLESKEQAEKNQSKVFLNVLGTQSGQKLKQESNEDLLIRLINNLLIVTSEEKSEKLDGILLSAGSHNMDKVMFDAKVTQRFSDKMPIFYAESIHGHGDNAGGFAGMLLGLGLFEGKIKTSLAALEITNRPSENQCFQNFIVLSLDRTGYAIATRIAK